MSTNPLSRRSQACAECNEEFSTTYNLKTHFSRAHPGKLFRAKGQTLLNFSSPPSKRSHDGNEVETTESVLDTVDQGSTSTTGEEHQGISEPMSTTPTRITVHASASESTLIKELQSVIDKYKGLDLNSPPKPLHYGQMSEIDDEIVSRVNVCTSLKDFKVILPDTFSVDRVNERILCRTCVPEISNQYNLPGYFRTENVENVREKVQSRQLRHLKEHILMHLKSTTHLQNAEKQSQEARIKSSLYARNREIGLKIGSLAYFIFYNKLPYLLFEKFLPLLSLSNIDIGQINHSEIFVRRLLDPCYRELQKRLRNHLNQVLPCTDHEPPVTLLLDKGTIKHDTSQLTMIRTPCLKGGVLFESFFAGNPTVTENCGLSLSQLLVNTVTGPLEWTDETLRERLSGACVDGQYIHLNLRKHLSDILQLPVEFMNDSVIWDAAHRLELACQHAKEGYTIGGQRIGGTSWLLELDNVLQHIMKIFRYGHNHAELRKICEEKKEVFLEFNLFSETRFVEYVHRTYDHFVRMYSILCEKLKRDEAMAETAKEETDVDNLQNLLVQIELVVDLLFMMDLSHLLTFCSKELQRFDVVPFYAMSVVDRLKCQLHNARDAFNSFKTPEFIHLHRTEHNKEYKVWQALDNGIKCITESQSFNNIHLLLRSDRGRVTRSGTSFGCDKEGFRSIILQRFKGYRVYLDLVISELCNRFEPWPEWLVLSEKCLNFTNKWEFEDRRESFSELLNTPHGIHPLLSDEKERLLAEYVTLHTNAMNVMAKLKGEDNEFTLEQVWYTLFTEEKYYKNCKFVNFIALKYLNRSHNECIVECAVSSVEEIDTSGRPLKDENVEKLNFIATNGPHPLVSMNLVDDILNNYFGKDWHFVITAESKWFVSKVVDRQFQCARNLPNSLQ